MFSSTLLINLLLLQVTVECPYVLIQSLIYGTIVYAMIQFDWTPAKFFLFIFFFYFTLLYFTYWGMVTVAITPNSQFAAIISTAIYGLWNLFSGFLIPRPVCMHVLSFLVFPQKNLQRLLCSTYFTFSPKRIKKLL